MTELIGKVALITGVSSGIGRAAARLFAQAGASVFGVDCDVEAEKCLQSELINYKFYFWAADLSTEQAAIETVAKCVKIYGKVDILYNNAGVSSVSPFVETTSAVLEQTMAVNFYAVFYLCQQVIPIMMNQGGGRIINTASELAVVAQPRFSAYCASKGAVLSLTRSLALEYACNNIYINALCPGPVKTQMLTQEFQAESDPEIERQASIDSVPIGRFGTPEEIAEVALFLAANAPQFMQGATLIVDGAKTIL